MIEAAAGREPDQNLFTWTLTEIRRMELRRWRSTYASIAQRSQVPAASTIAVDVFLENGGTPDG